MAGEGMNEDEARFRVMTGKEPDELDRKLGFDFIPYQLGKALTERENGYKIADDNETVEAVTIPAMLCRSSKQGLICVIG